MALDGPGPWSPDPSSRCAWCGRPAMCDARSVERYPGRAVERQCNGCGFNWTKDEGSLGALRYARDPKSGRWKRVFS